MGQLGIEVLSTVCTVLASLLVTLIFNIVVERHRRREKDKIASKEDAELLKIALQALLRSQLYELYEKWVPLHWAPKDVKENFENLYKNYHGLGQNGVMDHIHEEFMSLPTLNPKKTRTSSK